MHKHSKCLLKQTYACLCIGVSIKTLDQDPEGKDKQISNQVCWPHRFFLLKKTEQNNVRINTNYGKPLRSFMHHKEGIQHLTLGQLKPQLGPIKQERKVPHFPSGNQQMEEVYCLSTPKASACYLSFLFFLLFFLRHFINQQLDLTPVLPLAASVQRLAATHKHTNVLPSILIPPHSANALRYFQHFLVSASLLHHMGKRHEALFAWNPLFGHKNKKKKKKKKKQSGAWQQQEHSWKEIKHPALEHLHFPNSPVRVPIILYF